MLTESRPLKQYCCIKPCDEF